MVTFDAAAVWRTPTLWPITEYAVPPASGTTDPGYDIGPRILQHIAAAEEGPHSIGMLVNTHQFHPGMLKYAAELTQSPVKITDLTDTNSPAWQGAIAAQWLLWKDGVNENVEAPGQAVLAELARGNPLLAALYQQAAAYPLPNGDTVYLYHRAAGPGFGANVPDRMQAAAAVSAAIAAAASSHSTLLYASPALAVWVGMQAPQPAPERILQGGQEELAALAATGVLTGTLLAVTDGDTHDVESWLDARAYRSLAVGGDRAALVAYGFPSAPLVETGATAAWDGLQMTALSSHLQTQGGLVLPLEPSFDGNLDPNRKLSYRLQDAGGAVLAASDRALAPTDRFGLFVPPATPPGVYNVVALLYDAQTQAVLADRSGNGEVILFRVSVDQ
jgi:hypothetical protein